MTQNNKLTEGGITQALVRLALPIMGTAFAQMAYNLTDLFWIGRVGSNAVSAVGTAGFFAWLGMAFILIPKIGAEVGVAQSVGRKDKDEVKNYIRHSLQLIVLLALLYSSILIIFRNQLIGFFTIDDLEVVNMAVSYLVIIGIGMIFYFINPVFTSIFNGYGDSTTPFIINFIGLGLNIILDPILILGIGPIPAMGVVGAGIATITSQCVVTLVFIFKIRKNVPIFEKVNFLKKPNFYHVRRIVKLGLPVALQSAAFTIFAMFITRILASWGTVPIAVQKVGSQIEAISWMTASGFQTALAAFVGQNYGAKKWNRIYKGYMSAIGIMGLVGIFATCLLIFGAKPLFSLFIDEEEPIRYGVVYLQILGLSQLFMCIEIATAGAFNGLGKTIPPSIVSITFNGLRIPAALILSTETLLGLEGVWWSISMSSVFKGIILVTWFAFILLRNRNLIKDKQLQAA